MSELIDCHDEFTIRQRINFVKRSLRDMGHHNIGITVMPDAKSDVGVSIVMVDNDSGVSRPLDQKVFENISQVIKTANSKSTYS
jgi:hypothetical protein